MRAAQFIEPHRVEPGDRPDAKLVEPTDAVVRVVLACVHEADLEGIADAYAAMDERRAFKSLVRVVTV
jgi:hypothetical protein